jgi:TfoX/Sxy family transcriptional regulator of competence genes
MVFDDRLAARVRQRLDGHANVSERRMFGGLAFMVGGHMCCGVLGQELMVRVGPERYELIVTERHVRPMDFTGRPLIGMVYVEAEGLRTAKALGKWVDRGLAFVKTLPPKAATKSRRTRVR